MAISAPVTEASKKVVVKKIPYIYYPVQFKKHKISDLINFSNKISAMLLEYNLKLGLKIRYPNVKAQKIDIFTLETFKIDLASFKVKNKHGKTCFF